MTYRRDPSEIRRGFRSEDIIYQSTYSNSIFISLFFQQVNIGLALKLIGDARDRPATPTEESLVSTGAILGMIAGQVMIRVIDLM